MSNASGEVTTTYMSDYDKLPRAVRHALANSDRNWAATVVLKELRKRKNRNVLNSKHAVKLIQEWDDWANEQDAIKGFVLRQPKHKDQCYGRTPMVIRDAGHNRSKRETRHR